MNTCCDLLIVEHRETERLLQAMEHLLATGGEWEKLRNAYQALAADLKRHFVLEEQGLFAVLNPYRSMILMEVEHDDLLDLQAAFAEILQGNASAQDWHLQVMPAFSAWKERLLAHIKEEESGIFPLAEKWLEPEEKQKVLRRFAELQTSVHQAEPKLVRPMPGFQLAETELLTANITKPIRIQTLQEREHTQLQHLTLQAGKSMARHWAGQTQYITLLSGSVLFETDEERFQIKPGDMLTIDSRLYFSLTAITDASLLVVKVWPHPHFTKTLSALT